MNMAAVTQKNMTVVLDQAEVKFGEGHASTNTIAIELTNNGLKATVRVTVKVKCGNTEEALLEATTATVIAARTPVGELNKTIKDDQIEWQTGEFGTEIDKDKTLKITLKGFDSNTRPGPAKVEVVVQPEKDGDWGEGFKETFEVTKTAETPTEPTIHYFTVTPDYVLHAGRDSVTVSLYATDFDKIKLYRNNQLFRELPDKFIPAQKTVITPGSREVTVITASFHEGPSITTVYRLEASNKPKVPPIVEPPTIIQRTVHVISPGWNQIAPPQGYPTRLFVAPDFTSSKGASAPERLYGIFVDRDAKANLYSSATGVDDWRLEGGSVPPEMAMSPGVYYDNKLWLIGGSSVDPDATGKEVQVYEKDTVKSEMHWAEGPKTPPTMEARMGHTCVAVPGGPYKGIWVLGGYNKAGKCLDDVWTLRGETWSRQPAEESRWPARMRLAAACFRFDPNAPDDYEVWIYGGADSPNPKVRMTDLWSTVDGKTWIDQKKHGICPSPGEPLGAALLNYEVKVKSKSSLEKDTWHSRVFLAGTFLEPATSGKRNRHSSFIFEWHDANKVWQARSVGDGWQQFGGAAFYMQAIAFNTFIFIWSLHHELDPAAPPKLNILIPS
jgi:hypothetical protein